MSHTHQYNFKGRGPTTQTYRKLWLEHFKDGTFTKTSPLNWRVFCRVLFSSDFYTYQCEIPQSNIAADCGTHRTTIPKINQDLTKLNLIVCQNKITRAGKQPNKYILIIPESDSSRAQSTIYEGEVIANEEVDISVISKATIPPHVRLLQELFDNGYFTSLGRDHCTWKIYCGLLFRADFETGYCFPSIEQIAEDCGVSPRTVNKSLNKLEKDGLVRRVKWRTSDNNLANGYYVWPLDSELYNTKRTGTTSADAQRQHLKRTKATSTGEHKRHPETRKDDIQKRTAGTYKDVVDMRTNINSPQINTTTSSTNFGCAGGVGEDLFKEQIEEFVTLFYDFTKVAIERSSLEKPIFRNWVKARLETYGYQTVKYVLSNNHQLYTLKRLDTSLSNYHAYLQDKKESKGPELTGAEILLHNQLRMNAYTEMLEDQPDDQAIKGQINKLAKIIGKQQLQYTEKLTIAQQVDVCKKLEDYYGKKSERQSKTEYNNLRVAISGHRIGLEDQLKQETDPAFQLEQKRRLFESYEQKVRENPNGSNLFRPAMNRLKEQIEELEGQWS